MMEPYRDMAELASKRVEDEAAELEALCIGIERRQMKWAPTLGTYFYFAACAISGVCLGYATGHWTSALLFALPCWPLLFLFVPPTVPSYVRKYNQAQRELAEASARFTPTSSSTPAPSVGPQNNDSPKNS
jgi:hypothetical protein